MFEHLKKLSAAQLKTLSSLCAGAAILAAIALMLSGPSLLPNWMRLSFSSTSQTATLYNAVGTQPYVVPAGVTNLLVHLWGAGGTATAGVIVGDCDGYTIATIGSTPGGAGYTTATIPVTPGETLTVVVGGVNGGGSGAGAGAGAGGGYSGIFRGTPSQANALVIAGGGGGSGAYVFKVSGDCPYGHAYWGNFPGGHGGGSSGGWTNGSTGGTQVAGGTGGQAGGALSGGNAVMSFTGGGGAGYWGGGSGTNVPSQYGFGGGGGSGYCSPSLPSCSTVAATASGVAAMSSIAPSGAGNAGAPGAVALITANVSLTANPTTIGMNGTSTLTRSVSGVRPGSCTITDQSGTVILSNFGDNGSAGSMFLTSGSSFTVPADWISSNNTIEAIGGGGSGSSYNNSGGGGGGYTKALNVPLTPGTAVSYAVGAGGIAPSSRFSPVSGNPGGDTYFCNSTANCASIAGIAVMLGAKGGMGGLSQGGGGGSGGSATFGKCAAGLTCTRYSGGAGAGNSDTAGGGGGAGGPHGNGGTGGSTSGTNGGGSGGGASGGGSSGASIGTFFFGSPVYEGSAGGNNWSGTGGGAGGTDSFSRLGGGDADGKPGSNGGGGGGGYGDRGDSGAAGSGGTGGRGSEWDATHGSGGGGGGAGYDGGNGNPGNGGNGGLYGGGGGGATGPGDYVAGNGAPGLIVLSYILSPNKIVGPLSATKTYTLSCTSAPEGLPVSASATVTVSAVTPGSLSITATNNSGAPTSGTFSLNSDKPTTVAWTSSGANAASCSVQKYNSINNSTTTVSSGSGSGTSGDGPFPTGGSRRFTFACNDTSGNPMTPATVTLNISLVDICTDIPGTQSTVPPNCQTPIPNPGACIPPGWSWDGTQCVVTTTPGSITQQLTANPSRVRKGNTTSLSWATTGMTSCTLSQNGVIINNNAPLSSTGYASQPVNSSTNFILSCTDSANARTSSVIVTVLPTFQEI